MTDTNATVKLKFYANRALIAPSQFKRFVLQGHTVSNKAKQQTQHVLHVPKVLINRVKHLNIALIGKLFLCCVKSMIFVLRIGLLVVSFFVFHNLHFFNFSDAGKYNDKEQQTAETACIESAPGTFSPNRGEATFTLCPLGTWQNLTGSTTCNKCDFNTYNDKLGGEQEDACTPCPMDEQGQTSPILNRLQRMGRIGAH